MNLLFPNQNDTAYYFIKALHNSQASQFLPEHSSHIYTTHTHASLIEQWALRNVSTFSCGMQALKFIDKMSTKWTGVIVYIAGAIFSTDVGQKYLSQCILCVCVCVCVCACVCTCALCVCVCVCVLIPMQVLPKVFNISCWWI